MSLPCGCVILEAAHTAGSRQHSGLSLCSQPFSHLAAAGDRLPRRWLMTCLSRPVTNFCLHSQSRPFVLFCNTCIPSILYLFYMDYGLFKVV